MSRAPACSPRGLRRAATPFALLLSLAAGTACGQDETARPPLPDLPKRPADAGGMTGNGMPGGGMGGEGMTDGGMGDGGTTENGMSGGEPAPRPFVSEEPAADRAVPLPRPTAGAGRPSDAALRARFGMAGGACLPFGPPAPCGVGPADRCVGLPYAGFLYYGTPACDDDCANRTWTTDVAGQGEPAAARVARHARRHEAAPRGRRVWLPRSR